MRQLLCQAYDLSLYCGAHGVVVKALDQRSRGHEFDSQCWPCVKALGKLLIPHCLGPLSRNGYLVEWTQEKELCVWHNSCLSLYKVAY